MRKIVTLLLCAALLCAALPALAYEVALPIVAEKETFTIMVKKEDLCQNNWADKECVQFTEGKTNIHIEWIEVPSSGWKEKVSAAFFSGELPDAFISNKGVDLVTNMEMCAALDEYINDSTPNILQIFKDIPEVEGALRLSDGHIHSLPVGDVAVTNEIPNCMWINTTWLKALNLEMPKTIEQLYDVLVAFRDKDPNGNSQQDEIPLMVASGKLNQLFGLFGTLDNDNHVRVVDGKVVFTPVEDTYFEALQWLNKLYSEKLLFHEVFTADSQLVKSKGATDPASVGVFVEWYIDNLVTVHGDEYALLDPIEGPHGMMLWQKKPAPEGTLDGFVITTACKNPGALVRWYDYINSDLDILNLWNYGPEGVIWRYRADGLWETFNDNVPEGSSSSQIRRTLGTGPQAPLYAYFRFRGTDVEKLGSRLAAKAAANVIYRQCVPAENIPNGFGVADEEAERNMILLEIDHYLDQFIANSVVTGVDEAGWQAHLKTLSTLAIDEYVGYWQSYYEAHK